MIQLAYHPAFDAGHAMFRVLRLHLGLGLQAIEFDKLRILDFYLLFPFRAAGIRFKQSDLKLRALAKQAEEQAGYSVLPSDRALFTRMEPAQVAASQTLANRGLVDGGRLREGTIVFEPYPLPVDLQQRIEAANHEHAQLALRIVGPLNAYPLLGRDGLKDRTDLLEYRYDKV